MSSFLSDEQSVFWGFGEQRTVLNFQTVKLFYQQLGIKLMKVQ